MMGRVEERMMVAYYVHPKLTESLFAQLCAMLPREKCHLNFWLTFYQIKLKMILFLFAM